MTLGSAEAILGTLRDLRGVRGSFVVEEDGRLVHRDMAALFTDDLLEEAGSRPVRIRDVFADDEVTFAAIRFRDYILFVPELLSPRIYYARTYEEDRWSQSQILVRIARECFAAA